MAKKEAHKEAEEVQLNNEGTVETNEEAPVETAAPANEENNEGTQEEAPATKPSKEVKAPKNNPATVGTGVRNVRVHTTEAIDAIVAGERYVFRADKDVSVPADVAAILTNAHKAFRL